MTKQDVFYFKYVVWGYSGYKLSVLTIRKIHPRNFPVFSEPALKHLADVLIDTRHLENNGNPKVFKCFGLLLVIVGYADLQEKWGWKDCQTNSKDVNLTGKRFMRYISWKYRQWLLSGRKERSFLWKKVKNLFSLYQF